MGIGTYADVMPDQRVHVTAMAAIVQDLLSAEPAWQRVGLWLRERAENAGLDRHEGDALEALRLRLCDGDPTLCEASSLQWG